MPMSPSLPLALVTLCMLSAGQQWAVEAAPAPGTTADAALLPHIAQVASTITSLSGGFCQRTFRPGQAHPEVIDGQFALQVPDHYDLVETRSDDAGWRQRLCSDGIWQWDIAQTFAEMAPAVTKKPVGQGSADLRRIIDCLRGDLTALERDYTITATATPAGDGYQLTLSPKPGDERDLSHGLIVLDSAYHVRSLDLEQPSGTRIVIEVKTPVYNQPIQGGDSRFHGPDR